MTKDNEKKNSDPTESGQNTIALPNNEDLTDQTIVESIKNRQKKEEIGAQVFSKNNDLKTIYFTSDFIPFKTEADALRHADSLTDKTVTQITKKD